MDIRNFFKVKNAPAAPPVATSPNKSPKKQEQQADNEEEDELDAPPRKQIREVTTTTATTTTTTPSSSTKRARIEENITIAATTTPMQESSDDEDDDDDAPIISAKKSKSVSSSSSAAITTTTTTTTTTSPTKPRAVASQSQINALPAKYNPMDTTNDKEFGVSWEAGQPVPFAHLALVMENISQTKKRLEIQDMMSSLFRRVIAHTPEDLLPTVYLCLNKVEPDFMGCEMGVGESILIKAICEVSGKKKESVEAMYKEEGDLGKVAMDARTQQQTLFAYKPKPLAVRDVFQHYKELTKISGSKSMDAKVKIIKKLLLAAVKEEAKYVIRGIQGKLRIGLAEQTVLTALAHAVVLTPPPAVQPAGGDGVPKIMDLRAHLKNDSQVALKLESAVNLVKQAFSECPSYDEMIPALLTQPIENLLTACHISAGVPLKPMLAKPTKGVGEILNRFEGEKFTCEYKYDGERAQIHLLSNGTVRIFSRNSEENTSKYPDLIEVMPQAVVPGTTSFIVDAEVVAYDRTTNKILPFQRLSTRARKDVGTAADVKVQVLVLLFDLLLLNGESYLKKNLFERREMLRKTFVEVPHRVSFATGKDLSDTEDIMEFFQDAVRDSCEGLMIKTLENNATYEPSRRSMNWLKFKKDYQENLNDSMDLVPIGAYFGRGKRTGVYGGFLLACYDPDSDEFQAITKVGTGFSEADLEDLSTRLKATIAETGKPRNVNSDVECHVWFEPSMVWEVKAADLSISPIYKAAVGTVDPNKGIALRFPRFLRVRHDKNVEDATNASQVAQMYRDQAVVGNGGNGDDDGDDDEL